MNLVSSLPKSHTLYTSGKEPILTIRCKTTGELPIRSKWCPSGRACVCPTRPCRRNSITLKSSCPKSDRKARLPRGSTATKASCFLPRALLGPTVAGVPSPPSKAPRLRNTYPSLSSPSRPKLRSSGRVSDCTSLKTPSSLGIWWITSVSCLVNPRTRRVASLQASLTTLQIMGHGVKYENAPMSSSLWKNPEVTLIK